MLEQLKPLISFLVLAFLFSMLMLAECGCALKQQVKLPVESYLLIQHELKFKVCEKKVCKVKTLVNTGSGFVVHNVKGDSWALTAGHVCTAPKESVSSKMRVVSRGTAVYSVAVFHVLPRVDVCVLYIQGVNLPPVKSANSAPVRGSRSYALSSPYGIYDAGMVPKFDGYYAGKTTGVSNPSDRTAPFLELDAYTIPSRPGSSGGPIFNNKGELVGMVVMANQLFENFTLSPPSVVLREVIAAVKDGSARVSK